MAHFAEIDEDGIVIQVIVVADDSCGGGQMPESDPVGQAFIASLGLEGKWRQTSYNNNFRGTYAHIGYTYDAVLDKFVAPVNEWFASIATNSEIVLAAQAAVDFPSAPVNCDVFVAAGNTFFYNCMGW